MPALYPGIISIQEMSQGCDIVQSRRAITTRIAPVGRTSPTRNVSPNTSVILRSALPERETRSSPREQVVPQAGVGYAELEGRQQTLEGVVAKSAQRREEDLTRARRLYGVSQLSAKLVAGDVHAKGHLESGDVLDEEVPRVRAEGRELGQDVLDKVQERPRTGVGRAFC
jgi:hypothetical protein